MNSEAFAEITKRLSRDNPDTSFVASERKRLEDITISEGDLIDSILNHDGWKLVKRKLEEVRSGYVKEICDMNRCDTLKKVHDRQVIIDAIDLFMTSPRSFIEKRNLILDRRRQWQNKKT
jgi:hypothetical protein